MRRKQKQDALAKVSQFRQILSVKQMDRADCVVILSTRQAIADKKLIKTLAYRKEITRDYLSQGESSTKNLFLTVLPNAKGSRAILALADSNASVFETLVWARKVISACVETGKSKITINCLGLQAQEAQVTRAIYAALLATQGVMPNYKSKTLPQNTVTSLAFYGVEHKVDFVTEQAMAVGNNEARRLTTLPANYLTPAIYRQDIKVLAQQYGWSMHFYGTKALARKKAGAFLAVCQGSADQDAGIVHLSYTPANPKTRKQRRIALVGKGICFDTGGTNLKPARYMVDMHEDMEGSAVALGTLMALTRLDYPHPVDCWLALAQNHIGPKAYKQSDVVTAINGTTIEVVHTDAEGRMVLADTLALASKNKPDLIIDYATLTGSCVQALGSTYSGAFTNRDSLLPDIIEAGRDSGERVWPFPIDKDFDASLDSAVADIKQCTLDGEADHILAARFLQKFVGASPWLHIDLSAGKHKGGLAHIPTDITGFGVRFTVDLLLNKKITEELKFNKG